MHTAAGESTEAVYIFHNMVKKLQADHKPEYLAAVMESEGPTFRDQEFAAYKANRAAMPEDLVPHDWSHRTLIGRAPHPAVAVSRFLRPMT